MTTEAQKRAKKKYDEATARVVKLKLNVNTDMDILEKLKATGNMQGYIKGLIRKDLRGE